MGGSRSKKQRGFMVWVLMVVLAGFAFGAWRYSLSREDSKRTHQAAAEQLQKDKRREAERAELAKRLDEKKQQKDSFVTAQKSMDDLLVRWDDAVKVASSTSRISLSMPVTLLQDIRRDAEKLTLPPCMDGAKESLVHSMNSTIKGSMAFMRNELKTWGRTRR